MRTPALLTASLLLCLAAGTRQLSISEFDVPTAVESGTDAELRCRYELGPGETEDMLYVKWWWQPAASAGEDRRLIYQRIAGHVAELQHHNNTCTKEIGSNDTILLKDLRPHDSGTFECEVSNIDEIRKHENLTVYTKGTGPELNISTIDDGPDEGDAADLLVKCEAENVAPAPTLTLIYNGNEIDELSEVLSQSDDGMYRIFSNATLSKENVEAGEIGCRMTFPGQSFEHPPYEDVEHYDPAGASPTEPAGAVAADATPGPLQTPSDHGTTVHSSWALLTVAATLVQLIALK